MDGSGSSEKETRQSKNGKSSSESKKTSSASFGVGGSINDEERGWGAYFWSLNRFGLSFIVSLFVDTKRNESLQLLLYQLRSVLS